MKEAQASVLEPYLGASEFENHGERVVRGQRMSQAASDMFLGWQRSEGLDGEEHDFYIRQLWDWKASIDLSTMSDCGPARIQRGRADGRWPARMPARATGCAIAAYLGGGRERSTRRSRASPPPTPIRTSSTTSGWPKPSPRAKSPPSAASDLLALALTDPRDVLRALASAPNVSRPSESSARGIS